MPEKHKHEVSSWKDVEVREEMWRQGLLKDGWGSSWNAMNGIVRAKLEAEQKEALESGALKGRHFFVAVADGQACYRVVRENKKTVRVRLVPFMCMDDYADWNIGKEGTVYKDSVEHKINFR